jgi:hypothetical protein
MKLTIEGQRDYEARLVTYRIAGPGGYLGLSESGRRITFHADPQHEDVLSVDVAEEILIDVGLLTEETL